MVTFSKIPSFSKIPCESLRCGISARTPLMAGAGIAMSADVASRATGSLSARLHHNGSRAAAWIASALSPPTKARCREPPDFTSCRCPVFARHDKLLQLFKKGPPDWMSTLMKVVRSAVVTLCGVIGVALVVAAILFAVMTQPSLRC
jgi:hypothetical protein